MNDFMQSWREQEDRRKNTAIANKAVVMEALKAAGAKGAIACYDGSGDSGQMGNVDLIKPDSSYVLDGEDGDVDYSWGYTPDDHRMEWPDVKVTIRQFYNGENTTVDLEEAVTSVAWDMLESCYGGWENNDGGQGAIVFDVETGTVFIHHAHFFTDVNTSNAEF